MWPCSDAEALSMTVRYALSQQNRSIPFIGRLHKYANGEIGPMIYS